MFPKSLGTKVRAASKMLYIVVVYKLLAFLFLVVIFFVTSKSPYILICSLLSVNLTVSNRLRFEGGSSISLLDFSEAEILSESELEFSLICSVKMLFKLEVFNLEFNNEYALE